MPATKVPTLEHIGITEEELVKNKPQRNTHIFEEWHHDNKRWPKDKRLAKDVVHLRYSARFIVWKAIHQYFNNIL